MSSNLCLSQSLFLIRQSDNDKNQAVLYTTTEAKVVRNYVIALWIADIGHVAATYYVLGYDRFVDVGKYNPMAFGNVVVTVRTK